MRNLLYWDSASRAFEDDLLELRRKLTPFLEKGGYPIPITRVKGQEAGLNDEGGARRHAAFRERSHRSHGARIPALQA
ncbi:hypothetical protein SAMD00023353_1301000 [Rosellinia necatrix]|uniref:Uncharacterized protein n=1 Tax=Rosellinia necatrix TaxID=77044 RepID=A0A1S8A713_ROSNE|nr:hypothetical protein SAMD00023353_1301000 [Rosellinia necatrix]